MKPKSIIIMTALLIAASLPVQAISGYSQIFGWPDGSRSFPYQCGPFPENQKYGPHYDERCVYPYHRQYPILGLEAFRPGPIVRLSDDVSARWLAFNAIGVAWHGNPNGVTQVEFSLLDYGRVVIHRTLVVRPPYEAAVYVPYRAISVRVRTYGLLQSVLQEYVVPMPAHPAR